MIKLSAGCYVAADQIESVEVNAHRTGVTVRMKNGIGHNLDNDYAKTSYATMDRLVAAVESDLALEGKA